MAGLEGPPPFLEADWLLFQFDPSPERARRKYRRFVAQGKGVDIWGELKEVKGGRSWEGFVKRLAPLLGKRKLQREIPCRERLSARPSFGRVVCRVKGGKDTRIFVEYKYRLAEVGDHFRFHYSTVLHRLLTKKDLTPMMTHDSRFG